eukprot:309460_1
MECLESFNCLSVPLDANIKSSSANNEQINIFLKNENRHNIIYTYYQIKLSDIFAHCKFVSVPLLTKARAKIYNSTMNNTTLYMVGYKHMWLLIQQNMKTNKQKKK